MKCDLRTHNECGCAAGSCQQQPNAPAPVVSFSWRQHAATVAFGIVVALAAYWALNEADQQFKRQSLEQQEASVSWK